MLLSYCGNFVQSWYRHCETNMNCYLVALITWLYWYFFTYLLMWLELCALNTWIFMLHNKEVGSYM